MRDRPTSVSLNPDTGRLVSAGGLLRMDLVKLAGLLPLFVSLLPVYGMRLFTDALLSLCVLLFWHGAFVYLRKLPMVGSPFSLVSQALLFSVLFEAQVATVSLLLVVSFGCVLGELIFGGRGFSFLHPVALGGAGYFYLFSPPVIDASPGTALLPGLLVVVAVTLLLRIRAIHFETLTMMVLGLVLALGLTDQLEATAIWRNTPVLIMLLFVGADPIGDPLCRQARYLSGLLIGVLTALFGTDEPMRSVVDAILAISLLAPLLDYITLAVLYRARG